MLLCSGIGINPGVMSPPMSQRALTGIKPDSGPISNQTPNAQSQGQRAIVGQNNNTPPSLDISKVRGYDLFYNSLSMSADLLNYFNRNH